MKDINTVHYHTRNMRESCVGEYTYYDFIIDIIIDIVESLLQFQFTSCRLCIMFICIHYSHVHTVG